MICELASGLSLGHWGACLRCVVGWNGYVVYLGVEWRNLHAYLGVGVGCYLERGAIRVLGVSAQGSKWGDCGACLGGLGGEGGVLGVLY